MFGSDYDKQFGIPPFPFVQMDPAGGYFGGGALGNVAEGIAGTGASAPMALPPGMPVAGAAGAAGGAPGGGAPTLRGSAPDALPASASPSVAALRSGNPLAASQDAAGLLAGGGGGPADPVTLAGADPLGTAGAWGAANLLMRKGAGSPAMPSPAGAGRGA